MGVFAVDQHKCHAAGIARTVRPGMVRPVLDHDIAGPDNGFSPIEHQRYLAFQHDSVVDGLRAVHERMRGPGSGSGSMLVTHRFELLGGVGTCQFTDFFPFRREFDDPYTRRVFRRRKYQPSFVGIVGLGVDPCGRFQGMPHLKEGRAAGAADKLRTARYGADCSCWIPRDEFRDPAYR